LFLDILKFLFPRLAYIIPLYTMTFNRKIHLCSTALLCYTGGTINK
jgi:hypothetical protein